MPYVVPQPAADRSLLYRDRDYYTSMPSYGHTVTQIALTKDDEVEEVFSSFIIEAISTNDEEAVETTMTGEGSKIRVGDRLIRNITFSGTLLDSAAEGQTGQTAWLDFYERARISQISHTGRLVKVETTDFDFYGGFMRYEIQLDAADPHKITLSATLVCVRVDIPKMISSTKVAGSDFYGKVSYEGLVNVGVIGSLVMNPIDVRIPVEPGETTADDGTITTVASLRTLPATSAEPSDRAPTRFRVQ